MAEQNVADRDESESKDIENNGRYPATQCSLESDDEFGGPIPMNRPVRIPISPAVDDTPYCPEEVMAMLREAGWLLYQHATGMSVPAEQAGRAAWTITEVLAKYGEESTEEWYVDVAEWKHF
jgi:hypothetical protein